MKKFILDLTVIENIQLNRQYNLLILSHKEKLPVIRAGQFAQIRVDGSATTFLRRPISICFVDEAKNELWFLIQIVGDGTRKLSELKTNDILNVILPLGTTFSTPNKADSRIILIGGGVGVAPLLIYGEWLSKNGFKPTFLIGARSTNDLLLLDEFEKYGKVFFTTEDGSKGEIGYVTDHSVLKNQQFDSIFTCGPTPMMKAVAHYAKENEIFCEASLENMMGCGFGACLCCVTDTTEGNLCVCTEGPVFNINRLKWQI